MNTTNSDLSGLGPNNFDLIRLFAALQVAIAHVSMFLGAGYGVIAWANIPLGYAPGVPIFFFISGFLITRSYFNSRGVMSYFQKRVLRLYPALILCLFLSVASTILIGYLPISSVYTNEFLIWFAAQATAFQFYNPEFYRGYGSGVLNGSLWSIPVEIQFYIIFPFAMMLFRPRSWSIFALLAVFVGLSIYGRSISTSDHIVAKLFGVSFLPWFSMFLFGHLASVYWVQIKSVFVGKFLIWLVFYVILIFGSVIIGDGMIEFCPSSGVLEQMAA